MIIIGVDFHPEFQQVASVDTESEELQEKRLGHREEAETFYCALAAVASGYELGWKPAGTGAGSNDCWPSCRLNFGSEMTDAPVEKGTCQRTAPHINAFSIQAGDRSGMVAVRFCSVLDL